MTLNRFTIEAILHKSHEWKCVTHKFISMVIIIYVNQCQKCCLLLTLSYLNGLIPALRQISVGCCFCIDFFAATAAAAAKMVANLNMLYSSSSIQTCRNQRNNAKWQNVENDTRVSKCLSMVLCRHWFDVRQSVRTGEINQENEQTEEEKTESAEWLKWLITFACL